jgi:hypothetical protein
MINIIKFITKISSSIIKSTKKNSIVIGMGITFITTILYVNNLYKIRGQSLELCCTKLCNTNYKIDGEIKIDNVYNNNGIEDGIIVDFLGYSSDDYKKKIDFNIGFNNFTVEDGICTLYVDEKLTAIKSNIQQIGTVYFYNNFKTKSDVNKVILDYWENIHYTKKEEPIKIEKGNFTSIYIKTNCYQIEINNKVIIDIVKLIGLNSNVKLLKILNNESTQGTIKLYVDNENYIRKVVGEINIHSYKINFTVNYSEYKKEHEIKAIDYNQGKDITKYITE